MSTSFLNSSQRLSTNLHTENKNDHLIPLYTRNKVNQKVKTLMKGMKNNFGIVTCIGSDNFYVFTRQMLLHLDFKKSINLIQQEADEYEDYRSEQCKIQNMGIQLVAPKKSRRQSIEDEMETSFVRVNSYDMKKILQGQVQEIESEYELSHNQLIERQLQTQQFKKTSSSFVAEKTFSNKQPKSHSKNYIEKNQDTQSQTEKNSLPYRFQKRSSIQKSMPPKSKENSLSKKPLEQEKIPQSMKHKGMRRIVRNGEEKYVVRNDLLRVYGSKQIGTDKQKRPTEWLYCQLKDSDSLSVQFAYLMSSTIVFQLSFQRQPSKEQLEKQLRDYFQFYRKMESEINRYDDSYSDMPEVVVICPIEDTERIESDKVMFRGLFNQLQAFYVPENRKSSNNSQSPFTQFPKIQSPSKNKLPPTPKRMPISHKAPQNSSLSSKRKVRLQFRVVSEELDKSGVLRQNYSRMRQITTQGRDIFNEQSIKTIGGNWVTSECFVNLLDKISRTVPFLDMEGFYENWQTVFEEFIKSTMEDAANKYEQKVNELIMGKSIISQSRLMQAHQVAKKQTLRQFNQKKIGSSRVLIESNKQIKSGARLPSITNLSLSRRMSISRKLVESRRDLSMSQRGRDEPNQPQVSEEQLASLVQSRIEEQKQELSRKSKEESVKWCRKFLTAEYEQVRRKLISNQIKSIPNYKQEIEFLRDLYKKKLQNYSALEYEMMDEYSAFLMENVFSGFESLIAKERQQWKEKVKKEAKQTQELQNEMKEMKRIQVAKERSLSEQNLELSNKLQQVQSQMSRFTKQIDVKNKENNYLKIENQEKLQEQEKIHLEKIRSLRTEMEELKRQFTLKTTDLVYLQSELQKQQLLHQQTHQNYEQILLTYKNNVNQLEKRVKQLKKINQSNEQRIKNSLQKEEINQEINRITAQSNSKIQELQKLLEQKSREINQNQIKYVEKIEQARDEIQQLQSQRQQLQVQYNLLKQKFCEIQSRLPQYKSQQTQLQKAQKENQELAQKLQQVSNEKALFQQKLSLNAADFEEIKTKMNEAFNNHAHSLQEQIDELITENETLHQELHRIKNQTGTQTILTASKDQEISIKSKCKNCMQNQSKLMEALKIVDSLNESYHKLKNTSLNSKCYHCQADRKAR